MTTNTQNKTKQKQIKIALWNANSIVAKVGELTHFLNEHKIDIIALSETKLTPNLTLTIRNYTTYRTDRTRRAGGVAILVKNTLAHTLLPQTASHIEHVSIKLSNGVVIASCYSPPTKTITNADLDALVSQAPRVMALGDFNAKHTTWKNHKNNKNGETVFEYATNNAIQILGTPTPTFHHTRFTDRQGHSYIDLIINKNVTNLQDPQTLTELSSDHNPVVINWPTNMEPEPGPTTWLLGNVDWKRFKKELDANIVINGDISTNAELESAVTTFTRALQSARNQVAKKVAIKHKEDRLPDYILELIKDKNKQRKTWQRTHNAREADILRQKQQTVRQEIDNYKNKVWGDTIRAASTQDGSLWRLTRRLKNKYFKMPTLQNATPQTDVQKANILANAYAEASGGVQNTTDRQNVITDRVKHITSQTYPIPPPLLDRLRIKPKDVQIAVKNLPTNKAPGPDEIPNIIIKNMTKKATVQLTHIMNAIVLLQYFPHQWKHSITIPILKPGKNPNDPASYRPISLLSSLSKLAERVLLTRLKMLGVEEGIPDEQFGFRSGHNTTLCVARVLQDTLTNFNLGNSTLALALDFTKAFDTVWLDGLTYKLIRKHNLPPFVVALLHSYCLTVRFPKHTDTTPESHRAPSFPPPI